MSIGKYIFAGIGWACGGPLGAILGLVLGGVIEMVSDSTGSQQQVGGRYHNTGSSIDIHAALLVLAAAVMKADGNVSRTELDYVKKFLLKSYGEERGKELLHVLRDVLKQNIPVQDICLQVKVNTDYDTRYHMVEFLFGIAGADNLFTRQEEMMLRTIAVRLGILQRDFEAIYVRYAGHAYGGGYQTGSQSRSTEYVDPYTVLGLTSTASDDEVKKAYRRLAMKYHPDKVATLGDDIKANAEAQFRKINEAYERIKEQRGMK